MKIIVSCIPPEGLHLPVILERTWLQEAFAEFGEEVTCPRPVKVEAEIRKMGVTVVIKGSVATQLVMPCARCLDRATLDIEADFRYVMVPEPTRYKVDTELTSEDIEYGYYTNDAIDLLPLIYEQVCLQLPMVVLCHEDCRGICPRCGTNLNHKICTCPAEEIDVRWSALKKIVIEKANHR
ncbi:MAG: DUF177 domain-containing protein [Syntrophales bacterium]|nr:DUF177 domain-containing protein [Syntrophales bacterium]